MTTRNKWLATLCVTAAVSLAPAVSSAGVNIDVDIAPPAPRVEVVPPNRAGYVWAPGYWDYRGHDHVWVEGRLLREHRGQHWVPERWEQHGSKWHMERGRWER